MADGSEELSGVEAGLPAAPEPGTREFVTTGIFDAPRELVFSAWTEVEHLKKWFGPKGFTIPVAKLNLVPGGTFHYCMRAATGTEMWGKWTFREIVAPERLVLVNIFSNKHGNPIRHPFVENWPLEMLSTATFSEIDGMTLVRIAWIPIHASLTERQAFEDAREGMQEGWSGTFEQLREYLKTITGR